MSTGRSTSAKSLGAMVAMAGAIVGCAGTERHTEADTQVLEPPLVERLEQPPDEARNPPVIEGRGRIRIGRCQGRPGTGSLPGRPTGTSGHTKDRSATGSGASISWPIWKPTPGTRS